MRRNGALRILERSSRLVSQAESNFARDVATCLPIGTLVRWRHGVGKALRSAKVIDHSGDRIRVEGASGRRYWLSVPTLLCSEGAIVE